MAEIREFSKILELTKEFDLFEYFKARMVCVYVCLPKLVFELVFVIFTVYWQTAPSYVTMILHPSHANGVLYDSINCCIVFCCAVVWCVVTEWLCVLL